MRQRGFDILFLVIIAIVVALNVGFIYVAIHFIRKIW